MLAVSFVLSLQLLEDRLGDPPDVEPADRRHPDRVQRGARVVGAIGLVLHEEVAAAQRGEQPVRRRAGHPEQVRRLRHAQRLPFGHELQQPERVVDGRQPVATLRRRFLYPIRHGGKLSLSIPR